jgi:hypothetical protein
MSEEKSLDLSQVSVANLLNNEAPTAIPEPEVEEAPETVEEDPAAEVAEEVVAEAEESSVEEAETPDAVESAQEEPADTEDDPSVIEVLRSKMGYEVEGEFAEDYDGVAKFAGAVAEEIAKEQLDTVFSQFPDVEQYLQYRYNGGDPKQYFQATAPVVDYSAVEITDENVSIQRAVVQEFLQRSGYTGEEVTETVQEYLDAGILQRQANRSLGKLQQMQEKEAVEVVAKQKAEAEQHREQVQNQWTSIKGTIDKGSVKGFEIPTSDRKKFYSWMSEAVDKQGRTQRLVDREQMDMETQVAMEYLLWKKFDLNKLVSSTKNTKKAQNLKQKLQQKQPASQRMKGGKSSFKAPKKLPSLKDLL